MRTIFLGNGRFGLPALDALADSRHELLAVVTRPDRAEGRGRTKRPTPTKVRARERGVPVVEIDDLNAPGTASRLQALNAEIWVVVAFPIIPAELLAIPPAGTVNLHASLLPRYRGAAPVQRAIMDGVEVTGVTTFFIDAGVDTGAVCLQREVAIGPAENAGDLSARLADLGAGLLVETLDLVAAGTAPRQPQDPALATPAPRLTKEEGELDWNQPARRVVNRIRGLTPWPGAFTFFGPERLMVHAARPVEGMELPWPAEGAPEPGTLGGFLTDGTPVVSTADGTGVALLRLQRESRSAASGAAVIRGLRCKGGERFGAD